MPEAATSRSPTPFDSAALRERLAGTRFTDIRVFTEVDSTNHYLLDEARAGAPEGVVAVADFQHAGRGRLGRTWTAPPGASLLVSVLLRPPLATARAPVVTMAAGLAAVDAVWLAARFTPSLKWPNDLVVGSRKLAGILTEADVAGDEVRALVVGVGINCNWDEFPPEIAAAATACNLETGRPVDRHELLVHLLQRLDVRYTTLVGPRGIDAVLGEYRQRCATLGREVRVELPGGEVVEGRAEDVTEEGHLVVSTPVRRVIPAGDVTHLRHRGRSMP